MTTQERLAMLTNGWRDFKAEVDRTTSQLTSPQLNAAREAVLRGETVDPAAFGTLDRITTQLVEVFCGAVPFLANVLSEMQAMTAHRAALFDALSEVEELFASADCTSCGARLDCDEDDDRCVSGECDGDHPCKPDCVLDAARRVVMVERKEKTDAVR